MEAWSSSASYVTMLDTVFTSPCSQSGLPRLQILCLIGRAANIFPLARLANKYRRVKIPFKFQVIMWFSGLRGAIAFVLALDLPAQHFAEHYRVLVSTTLIIVLFTILILGGSTLPLLKMLRLHVDTTDLDMNKTQPMVRDPPPGRIRYIPLHPDI